MSNTLNCFGSDKYVLSPADGRTITLENSSSKRNVNHSVKLRNGSGTTKIKVKTNNKAWSLPARSSINLIYDGDNWVRDNKKNKKYNDFTEDDTSVPHTIESNTVAVSQNDE